MIKKRNKLIKIADRSDLGWKTVKEYESDDIAEDSADEKSERRSSPQRHAETTTSISVRDSEGAFNRKSHNSHGATSRVRSAYTTNSTSNPNPSASRPCFQCREATHWRQDCPYRT